MSKSIHIPIDHREFPPPYVESERVRNLEIEFERIWSENKNQPVEPSAPTLSILCTEDVLLTVDSRKNQPEPLHITKKETEKEISSSTKPSNSRNESKNEENNLFCTPKECTLKGCCICLFSRCFMILAHLILYISLFPQSFKNCFRTESNDPKNKI